MQSALIFIVGTIMVLSCFAHGILGWKAVGGALQAAGTPADLLTGVAVSWFLGSAAMGTFGAIVILGGMRFRKGDRSAMAMLRIIAAAYIVYGIGAYIATGYETHFLMLFIVPGLLLAAGSR
jgi:hypothetical protein